MSAADPDEDADDDIDLVAAQIPALCSKLLPAPIHQLVFMLEGREAAAVEQLLIALPAATTAP